MNRQQVVNLCFIFVAVVLLAYIVVLHWTVDAQGVMEHPGLVRWANRIAAIPSVGFGLYSVVVGTRTLRERRYPPRGMLIPFPHQRQANWNPVSTGIGLVFGGTCAIAGPLVMAGAIGW